MTFTIHKGKQTYEKRSELQSIKSLSNNPKLVYQPY